MSLEGQKIFPGDGATVEQVFDLADEYRRAADLLLPARRPKCPLSRAPYRLAAIHAIELYLNAILMRHGWSSAQLRGMQHDLAKRSAAVTAAGIVLKKRTLEHLKKLSEAREYLVMRYGPEASGTVTHLNQVESTLKHVAEKAEKIVKS
jgi:hypothetical protein